jgi:hypothetical protein
VRGGSFGRRKDSSAARRKAVRTSVAALFAVVLISVVLAAGCAGNEEASEDTAEDQTKEERAEVGKKGSKKGKARAQEATLEMNGDPGTEFSGSCAVGDEETEVSGQVPESFTYELDGGRLECEISKESADGELEVVFSAGGTRSVQRISGGTLNLTYENGRISSFSTSSSSSGGSSSSSQVVSSSQSSSSSITISP